MSSVTTAARPTSSDPRKVLLVEDDDDILDSLAALLRDEGYWVETCRNGKEALDRLRRDAPPDLIVLDLMMPVMNGWEFRAAQRADETLADIPVVAISADASPKAAAIHAERYLRKPFKASDLLLAMERTLLERERRAMARRVEDTERLALLGTLAAGVGHEIGNPLTYVIANLALAEDQLPMLRRELEVLVGPALQGGVSAQEVAGTSARARVQDLENLLRDSRAGADRVRVIVRDLQFFSRRPEHRSGPIDVRVVLESSLAMAQTQLRHRARLIRLFGDVPLVEADEARLAQVFLNIVVNALQSFGQDDRERNQVTVSTRLEGDWAVVEVRDNGRGMAPAVLARMFDPFFTTKKTGQGTGLGLSISREIVASFGGRIEVESEEGRGSVFRVLLKPAASNPSTELATNGTGPRPSVMPVHAPEQPVARTVWIVDDEVYVARSIQRMLEPMHRPRVFQTGKEILAALDRGEHFDVLFCDLLMPEMSGVELHRALSQRDPRLVERMVFLTGGAFTTESQEFLQTVAPRWLEKPFEMRTLLDAVERADPRGGGAGRAVPPADA